MRLTTLFTTPQLTSLLSADDHTLILSCLDPQTGAVTRVTVKADMVALPDEPLLFVRVNEESATGSGLPPGFVRNDENDNGYNDCGGGEPFMFDVLNYMAQEVDPPALWAITPRGEGFDLR